MGLDLPTTVILPTCNKNCLYSIPHLYLLITYQILWIKNTFGRRGVICEKNGLTDTNYFHENQLSDEYCRFLLILLSTVMPSMNESRASEMLSSLSPFVYFVVTR